MTRYRIFISSVQKELTEERQALKDYIEGDALLRRFFDVFLFERLPASDRRADDVYLDEVDRCDVYLGLFGKEYGYEDVSGQSPTEREFERATQQGKTRLIYVKGTDDKGRHPKMAALIRKAGDQLIRRRFGDIADLKSAVYASLVDELARHGVVSEKPFDERPCDGASLADLDADAVASFVHLARAKRDFPLAEDTPVQDVLIHLGLLRDGTPLNAAILLFGRTPQRFIPCAEVRCMHFHGTEIMRPAPFYRIFKGALFSQVEAAANFVLSVTNLSVGTRALGPQAPVRPEIPPDVVREAVVNALAHRDYTSQAAVQVAVFADRVEIWNPGELLPPLTPDSLRVPHRSITRNHRVCEALFLAGYIEKYGTGTLMMIRESVDHALPEPVFKQSGGEFVATIGRDWLTEEVMSKLGLNERQSRAVVVIKRDGKITNAIYQRVANVSRPTAIRDLADLVAKSVFTRHGMGRNASYVLVGKRLTNDSNDSQRHLPRNDSETTQMTHMHIRGTRHKPVKPVKQGGTKGTPKTVPSKHTGNIATPQRKRNTLSGNALQRHPSGRKTGRFGTRSREKRNPATSQADEQVVEQVAGMLAACQERAISKTELLGAVHLANAYLNYRRHVAPLLEAGLIEMTVPDKPTNRLQKYRLTDKGRAWLRKARP